MLARRLTHAFPGSQPGNYGAEVECSWGKVLRKNPPGPPVSLGPLYPPFLLHEGRRLAEPTTPRGSQAVRESCR